MAVNRAVSSHLVTKERAFRNEWPCRFRLLLGFEDASGIRGKGCSP